MFVIESYQEDRYGVVLKDLANIIGVFVHLIQTVDKFFRLKAVGFSLFFTVFLEKSVFRIRP